jgi:protein required for attachment to host cells
VLAEAEFAGKVCDLLKASLERGDFSRLVIAAGPHMLGKIRETLSESLSKVVLAELDKDLTEVPFNELPKHFDHVLAVSK